MEDELLVDRILAGDQGAFRLLIERYASYIFQTVYGVLRSAKDAEDAAQEAFVQIHLSLPGYERKGLKTWMTRIAVNKAIDWKRKLARRKEMLIDGEAASPPQLVQIAAAAPATETIALSRERRRKLATEIETLPPNYRDVIVAYYFEEKTYQQIAVEQGLEVKSVESRLYRAKQWMRKNWKEEEFR